MTPLGKPWAALVPPEAERTAPVSRGSRGWSSKRLRARLVRAVPALRALGFVGAVAIVVTMAVRAARELAVGDVALWPLVPAFAAAVAWWLLLARGWALLLTGRSRSRDIGTWCRTQALRYLPGGIWAPASRAVIVRGTLPDKLATVAAENAIALGAALAIGGVALAAAGDPRWLPLVLAIAIPPLASRLAARRTRVTPRRTLIATWNYLAGFLAYALAAVLVQSAVSGFQEPLAVAGSAAVAWSVGLIVVVAPSGLAVRELVYVVILSSRVPEADLLGAAVALRLVTIFAELAVLVVAGRTALPLRASNAG